MSSFVSLSVLLSHDVQVYRSITLHYAEYQRRKREAANFKTDTFLNTLPTEAVTLIFQYAFLSGAPLSSEACHEHQNHVNNQVLRTTISLSGVSREWRRLVLANPMLWSYVVIQPYCHLRWRPVHCWDFYDDARMLIERSAPHHLQLCLKFDFSLPRNHYRLLTRLVSDNMHRLSYFEVTGSRDDKFLAFIDDLKFPTKDLVLAMHSQRPFNTTPASLYLDFLRSFRRDLSQVDRRWLTHLVIRQRITLRRFKQILEDMVALLSCNIHCISDGETTPVEINHPRLEQLQILFCSSRSVDLLAAPRLRILKMHARLVVVPGSAPGLQEVHLTGAHPRMFTFLNDLRLPLPVIFLDYKTLKFLVKRHRPLPVFTLRITHLVVQPFECSHGPIFSHQNHIDALCWLVENIAGLVCVTYRSNIPLPLPARTQSHIERVAKKPGFVSFTFYLPQH